MLVRQVLFKLLITRRDACVLHNTESQEGIIEGIITPLIDPRKTHGILDDSFHNTINSKEFIGIEMSGPLFHISPRHF